MQEAKVLKYWTLIEHLRGLIANGDLPPGSRVPSLAEMQAEFGVSRATVEKAYTLLEQDRVLVREQGRGTFVAQPRSATVTASSTKYRLGLVMHVDSMTDSYTRELLVGVRQEATRHNAELRWLSDEEVNDGTKADALIFYCHPTEALALQLPAEVPQVLLFQHSADFTCVGPDDFEGARQATRHLLSLGHRRIAYLLWNEESSISRRRMAGYRAAMNEAGEPCEEGLTRYLRTPRISHYRQAVQDMMQQWLREDWSALGCTAILAHNDEAAIGIIKVLRANGLRVPEDISVVGFDGTELSELSTPSLTTIKVPLPEIGATAVRIVTEQKEKSIPCEPRKVVLPVELKIGESTAPVQS